LRAASDSEGEAMEEAAHLVGASDVSAMIAVGTEGSNSGPRRDARSLDEDALSNASVDSDEDVARPSARANAGSHVVANLLQQLASEPSDEAECAAKFSLYEGYASEVENMRNTLFKFHEESRPALPPAIVSDMDRKINGIDIAEALGIPDDAREWFVYHMMRQAERNNSKMAGMLDAFDKKLKFLAQNDQAECPVCLEDFGEGPKAAETLGCCHKVCKECWTNWARVSHGRPFCPFCRHDEFMGAVASRAARSAVDSDSDSDASDP